MHNKYSHLFIVSACIQGGVIVSQFVAAFFLTPSEMGLIRSIESALSIMILVGSFGCQTNAIMGATASHGLDRLNILKNIYITTLIGTIIVIFGVLIFHIFFSSQNLIQSILAISGVMLLSNAVRVTSSFLLGCGMVDKIYFYLTIFTILGMSFNIVSAFYWGVSGWIVGRYLSEFIILLFLSIIVHKLIGPINWRDRIPFKEIRNYLSDGFKINFSLIVRTIGDNLPLLMMAMLQMPTQELGFLGMAILISNTVILPISILAQRAFPKMVIHKYQLTELSSLTKSLGRLSFKLGILICIFLFISSVFSYHVISGAYANAFLLTTMLCWSIPLKSIAIAYGTSLMALGCYGTTTKINIIEVVLLVFGGLIAIKLWGVIGMVSVIILGNLFSALAHSMVAKTIISSKINEKNFENAS